MEINILERELEHSVNFIKRENEKALRRIERKRKTVVKKISERFNKASKTEELKSQNKENQAVEEFSRKTSHHIYNALNSDYQTLQDRSDLVGINEEDMEKAGKIYDLIQTAETTEEKQRMESLLSMIDTGEKSKKVVEALSSSDTIYKKDITSYVASTPSGELYLLSPIDGDDNKELSKSLEDKINQVLSLNEITVGGTPSIKPGYSVSDFKIDKVKFHSDLDIINGFILYKINPENEKDSEKLQENLKIKLEELQPTEFEKMGLTHKVQKIRPEIIEFYKTHSPEEMHSYGDVIENLKSQGNENVNLEHASELIGVSQKIIKALVTRGKLRINPNGEINLDSINIYISKKQEKQIPKKRLAFESQTPRDIKYEALERLSKYGQELSTNQVKDILGFKGSSSVGMIQDSLEFERIGKNNVYSAESVRKYIEEKTPSNRGWEKTK